MRANFLQPSSKFSKLIDDDVRHSLPISQMGNYQDHLKKMPMPLREIESAPVRQHMFGNPFKINKNMIMDEVVMDEVSLVPNGGPGGGGNQVKSVKRPVTAVDTPALIGTKRLRKGERNCLFWFIIINTVFFVLQELCQKTSFTEGAYPIRHLLFPLKNPNLTSRRLQLQK